MSRVLKFVHCADIHLDAPFREHGPGGYARARRQDIQNAFLKIIREVRDEKADLLLVSGDLYEHRYITRKTMDWLNSALSKIKTPVVMIPGNHDPYVANSWYKVWEWPSNVYILSPENPSLVFENEKVSLYGIGFTSFKQDKPDLSRVTPPKPGYFNILMLHGTLDMDFTRQAYNPVTSAELGALNYDYYALGHFHTMHRDYTLKNAFNPGSPEPLGFDEPGGHGAFFVTLTGEQGRTRIDVREFETAGRAYHDRKLDITGCKTLDEVTIRILSLLEGLDPQRDIVRLTLHGRTDLVFDPDMLAKQFSDEWFSLQIENCTRKAFDIDRLRNDPSLKGAFVRETEERLRAVEAKLREEPGNKAFEAERERLGLALDYGLEALENGRIEWWSEI